MWLTEYEKSESEYLKERLCDLVRVRPTPLYIVLMIRVIIIPSSYLELVIPRAAFYWQYCK